MTARRASPGTPDVKLAQNRKLPSRKAPDAATKLPPYKLLPVSELTPHPRNPRTHSPADIDILCRKITADGWTNPIAVAGKQHDILAGHRRRLAAIKLGLEMVPTIDLSHLSEAQRLAYIIWDNKSTLSGGWDTDLLGSMMLDLDALKFPLDMTGFDALELDNLLGPAAGLTDPDDAPPVQAEAVSRTGDTWHLGRHVLHCADCRDVLPTLAGVDAVVTSPPYNMRAGTSFHMGHKGSMLPGAALASGYDTHSDDMPWPEYEAWQREVLTLCWATLSDSGAIFYNHKPRPQDGELWLPLTLNPGLPLRQIIVWDRGGGINYSASHFLPMQEWILLFAKPGFALKDRQSSAAGDVWTFGPEGKPVHPAAFPAELPRRALQAIEAPIVLDPFAGSGTTLIAAEQTGRACVAIEISPNYCDVAIRRWEAFTGATALHADGRAFSAIAAERTRGKVAA
jgi:DNA modification methylase